MAARKSVYNEEKANSVFAVKIRKLFEESGKTHSSLAEYIEECTGESVTRQAVGQWCNGNTCPNLRTVPLIADYFGVSTDYLLTDTEIRTADTDMKAVCEYTGLSEGAVNALRGLFEQAKAPISTPYIDAINFLLDDVTKGVFFDNADQPHTNLLVFLSEYLITTMKKGRADNDYFILKGVMISSSDMEKALSASDDTVPPGHEEDTMLINCIKQSEIVEKVLFDRVCEAMKKAKTLYHKKAGE